MTRAKTTLAALVLVCLAALVLGASLGASGPAGAAAGLTKKKVQKIAAQVVAKQAPTLEVARAATAGSATTAGSAASAGDAAKLAGQAPGAYLTSAYTITGAQLQTATTGVLVTITPSGVPAGRYLLTYDLAFDREAGTSVGCGVDVGPGAQVGVARSQYDVVSGSAVVTVGAAAPTITCSSDGQIDVRSPGSTDSHLTFVRLDTVVGAGASVATLNVM